MRNKILLITVSLLTLISFTRCSDDNEFKEVKVTPVNAFYSPTDVKNVILQSSATTSLYFEWEKATAEDNGLVYYDVLFDKEDGDFSNPIFVVTADNKGISPGASITHKVLNKIAGLAGIASAEEGVIKWTVMSSRGLTQTIASALSRKLNVTRIAGIDTPDALFLTGEASENGADLSKALPARLLKGTSEYEIFTKLEAGKEYYFVDSKTKVSRTFTIKDGKLKEEEGGATVAEDGIYRISMDFASASVSIKQINKINWKMCTAGQVVELIYKGNGSWRTDNIVPDFTTRWSDDRYFFWATIDGVEQKIGSENKDNSNPSTTTGSYFNVFFYPSSENNEWDYSFKFPNKEVQKCNIAIYLNADSDAYYHEIEY